MDIIFASTDKGKIREFKEILAPYGINVISLADLDFKDDIIEDGNTFLENALIKAKTISKYYNKAEQKVFTNLGGPEHKLKKFIRYSIVQNKR